MRKLALLGAAALMALTAGPALAGNSSGGGAQKSIITLSDSSGGGCPASQGGTSLGFVILNTAGQPGADNKVVGEVSLKDGTPNTTYMVFLQKNNNDMCGSGMGIASLTTNSQGNGNAHIDSEAAPLTGPGTYYVHLKTAGQDLASVPVPLD